MRYIIKGLKKLNYNNIQKNKKTKFLDLDILDVINDYMQTNSHKEIQINVITERGKFENPADLFQTIFPHKKTG
jgi:hypothetical protein